MDLDTLKMVFALMAVAGGVICAVALSYSNSVTAWRSKLGVCAIIGLILLGAGFGGAIIVVSQKPPSTTGYRSSSSYGVVAFNYGYCLQPSGHYGWGLCYKPF